MRGLVHVATSADGFIARADGSVDWLEVDDGNEDYGFAAFMDSIDALVMGRNTYDTVLAFGEWHYGDKPVIVLTNRPVEPPLSPIAVVEAISLSPVELAAELDRRGIDQVYVDGGQTIQSFLEAGLIDRLTITTIPVLLGSGIPLFGPSEDDVQLRLVSVAPFTNGLVQTTYDVV